MHDIGDILSLYPEYDKAYGPYSGKDGRKRIVLKKSGERNNPSRTISFPKALKEIELGKRLSSNETVDHQDRNKYNDDLINLNVIDRSTHASIDALRVRIDPINCPICDNVFIPNSDQIKTRDQEKAGPFCSKSCVGTYTANLRSGGSKIERMNLNKTYIRINK